MSTKHFQLENVMFSFTFPDETYFNDFCHIINLFQRAKAIIPLPIKSCTTVEGASPVLNGANL